MSTLTRARSLATKAGRAERRVVRIQRRLWLAQLLMWPLLITAAAGAAVWLVRSPRPARPVPGPPPADVRLP